MVDPGRPLRPLLQVEQVVPAHMASLASSTWYSLSPPQADLRLRFLSLPIANPGPVSLGQFITHLPLGTGNKVGGAGVPLDSGWTRPCCLSPCDLPPVPPSHPRAQVHPLFPAGSHPPQEQAGPIPLRPRPQPHQVQVRGADGGVEGDTVSGAEGALRSPAQNTQGQVLAKRLPVVWGPLFCSVGVCLPFRED